MTEQPAQEPKPSKGAPAPPTSYGPAPDPHGAYPGPDEGGYAPLPDLDPDDYGPPGPGYGPPDAGTAPRRSSWWRRTWRHVTDALSRR